jgi:predicted DNA-binding transcriptional regulator AlpA
MSDYLSARDLSHRFRCSTRTIYRWMKRGINPFPAPCIKYEGSGNLWDSADIMAWEQRERLRTQELSTDDTRDKQARLHLARLKRRKS